MSHPGSISRRLAHPAGRRDPRRATGRLWLAAAGLALALGASTNAGAATLYSGYIASADAAKLICYVMNVGSTPVKVSSPHIVNDAGYNALQFGDCGFVGTLQPGKRCGFFSWLEDGAASVTVDSGKSVIRATCQLNDASGNILATTQMR